MTTTSPLHVVVAGGGVGAIEAVLALHDLAGDRVRLTIVAPERDFTLRPLRTAEPSPPITSAPTRSASSPHAWAPT